MPPDRVERMNANTLGSRLNLSISRCRSSTLVPPSSRRYVWPCRDRNRSSTSSILLICVKMSTLCPSVLRRRNIESSTCSFPQSYCTRRRSGKAAVVRRNHGWRMCNDGDMWRCTLADTAATAVSSRGVVLTPSRAGRRTAAPGMTMVNASTAGRHCSHRSDAVCTALRRAGASRQRLRGFSEARAAPSAPRSGSVTARRRSHP